MGLTVVNGRAESASPHADLRESALSLARAIEDLNWINLSADPGEIDERLPEKERKDRMKAARMYVKNNPLAKQANALLINYTIGRGVSLTAANKNLVGRLVNEFWNDPVNRMTFTGQQSMSDFLTGTFTDGAQYLVLFPDKDEGTLQLGYLDPLYVDDIVFDPENSRIPLWFKVTRPKTKYDFKGEFSRLDDETETVWYRHWRNERPTDPKGKKAPKKVEPGLVYQAKRGKGKWGVSEIQAAAPWLRAHREFMEDRTTLTKAAASIAWKKKRKGSGQSDINAEAERLRSSLSNSLSTQGGYERNPPPTGASTIVENEHSNMEWVKTDTGGSNALADERILRMMAGSGMGGIPNHYFGDEANANLASATSMELPLLKQYESWQRWLGDIIRDLIEFMLATAHEAKRIGPRDDTSRYADRNLTQEKVLDTAASVGVPTQEV